MSINDVIKLNENVIKAWNDHDVEKMLSYYDTNITWRDSAVPEPYKGKDGAKTFYNMWHTAFPDFKIKIINTFANETGIAVEIEFSGTNTGKLQMGDSPAIPATNKKVSANRGSYFAWVKDGKVYKINTYPDTLGMMAQLGLMQEMHA